MEKEDQEQNLRFQQKFVANVDSQSLFVYFFNYLKLIKLMISKFDTYTDQSQINLSDLAGGQSCEYLREIEIQTKLDKNISPRMEVIETKLFSSENKIRNQKAAGRPANVKQVNDIVEQKAALILNPRFDVAGLVCSKYINSRDSCLVSPMVNSDFIDSSNSCAEKQAPTRPTSECHLLDLTKTDLTSNYVSCTDNKKIFNSEDAITLKLATLIQSMMKNVLNITQDVNSSEVSIEGLSVTMSIDIRKHKQGTDSIELNDKISSITKQLAVQFKEGLPTIANIQDLNTIITNRIEQQPHDEILHDDRLLVVEEEQDMFSLLDGVCSDDTLTLENITSVIDLTCCDTLENITSVIGLTCCDESNKEELKITSSTNMGNVPQDEKFYDDKLRAVAEEEMLSLVNGDFSDVIPVVDLVCIKEFNKEELKAMKATAIEELRRQNELLHSDQLLTVNKEEEISRVADRMCSNDISIVENRILIQKLQCNELLFDDKKEISTIKFKKMVTKDLNNELKEMENTELNNELLEIVNSELTQLATIEENTELLEIKSKYEVKQCSTISLSYKKNSNIENSVSSSEHGKSKKTNLPVSKYCTATENFLQLLSILNDTFVNGPLMFSVMVPAFYFRTWYFQNIRQGFLLYMMLRKANISTLNYMRNLYFVIITTDSQSIRIIVNFALQNATLLHFKEPAVYFTGDCSRYTVSAKEVQQIFSPETGIIESCTTYEDSIHYSNNTNIQSRSDLVSTYSTLLDEKTNAATSYLRLDWYDELQRKDVAVGESKFELQSHISKLKLSGMYSSRNNICPTNVSVPKTEIGTFFIHNVNETVFEQFSIDRYTEAVFGKGNSDFYNIFFKCLGHTIACSMLSFFISMM